MRKYPAKIGIKGRCPVVYLPVRIDNQTGTDANFFASIASFARSFARKARRDR